MTYEELVAKVRSAWDARIILTAVELGVADALAGAELTAAEVAAKLGGDERATGLLLDALVALGLALKSAGRYSNSKVAAERLATGSPGCKAAGLRHHAHLWSSWSKLSDIVKTGQAPGGESERTDDEYHDFVRAMYDYAWEGAGALAAGLDLSGASSMLDLGGGPGSFAIAFCERNPELRAVIADRPLALDVAAEIVEKHGAGDRVSLMPCDFITGDIGSGYDLVLVSQIIHAYGEDDNRMVFGKVRDALAPGGTLVIQDFLLDDDRTSPPPAAIFAINMLVNTAEGRTYTWTEVEGWLGDLGFTGIERKKIEGAASVIVARK